MKILRNALAATKRVGRELSMAKVYTVTDVCAAIDNYLLGKTDRKQFTVWLTPLVWQEEGVSEAIDLAWSVALLLAEASRGHLDEDELRASLRTLVDQSVPA